MRAEERRGEQKTREDEKGGEERRGDERETEKEREIGISSAGSLEKRPQQSGQGQSEVPWTSIPPHGQEGQY